VNVKGGLALPHIQVLDDDVTRHGVGARNILIEGNRIHDNGNVGSLFEHNTYTEALGITYQYNYFGRTTAARTAIT
jgi:hypothetical protein